MATFHIEPDPETKQMLTALMQQVNTLLKSHQKLESMLQAQNLQDQELSAKEVAALIGKQYTYFQNHVRHTRGFPKPIKGTDAKHQQARWYKSEILAYKNANKQPTA